MAEAHLGTINHSYRLQKEKKWTDSQRKEWLLRVFETEIELRGTLMKYKAALQGLYFPVLATPRIYYSEGVVAAVEGGYVITASRLGKLNDNDKAGRPFVVLVSADENLVVLRGARRELMAQLRRAADHEAPVKWYGYGLPTRAATRFELQFDVDNLSDLFVRRKSGAAALGKRPMPQAQDESRLTASIDKHVVGDVAEITRLAKTVHDHPAQELQAPVPPGNAQTMRSSGPEYPPSVSIQSNSGKRPEAVASTTRSRDMRGADARVAEWHKTVRREYDALLIGHVEVERQTAANHRSNWLNPHLERKPWLWGRSAWQATLVELESVDRKNIAYWERLKARELDQSEIDQARKEAARRAKRKHPEFSEFTPKM